MSASHGSTIVVGVRLSDIFEVKEVVQNVTRYNEKTGQPYQKEERIQKCYLLGVEIEQEPSNPEEWIEDRTGLKAYCTGNNAYDVYGSKGWGEYDFGLYVVGLSVANTDSAEIKSFSQVKLNETGG